MTYAELKDKHRQEISVFPLAFAFNDKQFKDGMQKLGLKETDIHKVYKLGNTGGFYRISDSEKLHAMFKRHVYEMEDAIAADLEGDGFIKDMFYTEMCDHEYCITRDSEVILDALDLRAKDVANNAALRRGWVLAAELYNKSHTFSG